LAGAYAVEQHPMNRVRLDKFTPETWGKFDAKDLEPVKRAIIRRRRVLA